MSVSRLLYACVRFYVWFLTMAQLCHGRPPSKKLELPFLEEQSVGSEVHDLKEDFLAGRRSDVHFKMIKQYMSVGSDTVNSQAQWVSLDEKSGIISVKRPVDREHDCVGDESLPCVIHVKIVRKPQRVLLVIDIKLNVIDINDHSPVFPIAPVININVSESVPVTTRINIDRYLAGDADTGPNAKVYYTLSRSEFFSIHTFKDSTGAPHMELVVTDKLDHEASTTYDLTLTATDRGTPQQKSSSVILRVHVVDANDNAPVFEQQVYHLELQENLGPASTITTVHATDEDSGAFGEIQYFVPESGNSVVAYNLVSVDPVTGEVFLRNSLDREKHNNIRIVIGARDLAGAKSKVGKTILVIKVDDENDNAPLIEIGIIVDSSQNTAFLSELSKIGTYVAEVTANDADVNINGQVDISITTQVLPFSHADWIRPEEKALLATLGAEDVSDFFVLDDGSFIITRKPLDRETHPGFLINVLACDQGVRPLCSSKNLTILLLDENDNNPKFLNKAQTFTLPEDTRLGHLLTTVEATDRDALYHMPNSLIQDAGLTQTYNGMIRYELANTPGCFNIDEQTGKIKLSGSLDYEKKKTWTLDVIARDMGIPSRSSNLSLMITVTDVNDNVPLFSNPAISNLTVPATIRSGDVITKIKAIDYDDDGHSAVSYSILSEDGVRPPPSVFVLDQLNGDLRLNMSNPNLKETIGCHSLMIKAKDSGSPSLEGYTTLRVEVYDLPLAALPKFTEVEEDETDETGGDFTIILIVSLASATLLLVLVLVGVIFKCKKENKEIRTYNCRSEESKKAWRLSSTEEPTSPNDVLMMSHNRAVTSHDSNTNSVAYGQNIDSQGGNDIRVSLDSNSNRSSQRSLRRKMTGFTKDSRFQQPVITQLDGDSGRGDSDHDAATETGSYEDKNKPSSPEIARPTLPPSNSFQAVNCADNDMGPMCTHMCREYGHSDTCWMPPPDHQVQENVYYPAGQQRSMTPTYTPHPAVYSYNPPFVGGLETICETQPLHSVLGEGYDLDQSGNYLPFRYGYAATTEATLSNPAEDSYYSENNPEASSSFWNSQTSDPNNISGATISDSGAPHCSGEGYCMYANVPPQVGSHSPSDRFHDGLPVADCQVTSSPHYQPDVANPGHSSSGNRSVRNSSCGRPASSVSGNPRPNVSLHEELLQRRFLAQAHHASRTDDVQMRSPHESQYGEVTMQETQQILNNIDQLIDD